MKLQPSNRALVSYACARRYVACYRVAQRER
jgi:hypothetical protein